MLFRLSRRNEVGPFVVARRPDDEQQLSRVPTNALKAQLAIGLSHILARQQITIKEVRQLRQIDAVLGDVRLAFGFVEGDHKSNCRCILTDTTADPPGRGGHEACWSPIACSAYYCEFVALAHRLNTWLVTMDKKVRRAFPERGVSLGS
jgi:hypothetical protein